MITANAGDATGSTAEEFNKINNATSVAVNMNTVTALAASGLSAVNTLALAINAGEFTNGGNLTTVAISDNTIDAGALATAIDNLDAINGGSSTDMTLASGATILSLIHI